MLSLRYPPAIVTRSLELNVSRSLNGNGFVVSFLVSFLIVMSVYLTVSSLMMLGKLNRGLLAEDYFVKNVETVLS